MPYTERSKFMFMSAGIVLGHYPMIRNENVQDILQFMDTILYPDNLPDYVVYDRACQLTLSFKQGNLLSGYGDRWYWGVGAPRWRVDRFHFLGHSSEDMNCR